MTDNSYPQQSERYLVWFKQGEYDLAAAQMSMENGFYEWSTFQAVQSVEKALKSIIVYSGVNPPRIHKLQTLMGICNRVCVEFKRTKFEFRFLESFTFISRYPFLLPGKTKTPHEIITLDDAQKALKQARSFLQKISVILSHPTGVKEIEGLDFEYTEVFTKAEISTRLQQISDQLVEAFDPEKIILFGRFAREENVSKLSTMDILVVADTDLPFVERIYKARKATRQSEPIIEPLVYTPEEFKVMTEEVGEGFLENALAEGRVIYSKDSQAQDKEN